MRTFLVVLGTLLIGVSCIKAQCSVTLPLPVITDIDRGEIFSLELTDEVTNVTYLSATSTSGIDEAILKDFFNFEISDGNLTMSTTTGFDSFSEEAYSDGQSIVAVTIRLLFDCSSVVQILYLQITDSLAFPPTFDQTEYTYLVPMPITRYSDFTLNGDPITVKEINFSNKDMSFSIEPDHFEIVATQITNKTFKASFQARELYQFTESQTYTLTAKNTAGNTTSVQLKIEINSAEGLDTPLFVEPYYLYEFSDNALNPKSGSIKVTTLKPDNNTYELQGDYESLFEVTFSNETAEFDLSLSGTFPAGTTGQIFLSLSYTTDATTTTAIIVDIIEVVPLFSRSYYEGVYDAATNLIEWTENVNISAATDVKLDNELFTISQTDYSIQTTRVLSETDFDANLNIIFTITATSSTNNEAEVVVLVSMKSEFVSALQFDNAIYNAKYEETGDTATVTLDADSKIGFSNLSDFTGIEILVNAAFENYFDVILDGDEWKINVTNKLPRETLLSNTELVFSVTATKTSEGVSADAALVISLPEKVEIQFGEPYYKATYARGDDADTVVLDEAITIQGIEGLDDFSIVVEGYEEHFTGICDNATLECTLELQKELNDTTLSLTELLLTLMASTSDNLSSGKSVLLLNLPAKNSTFSFVGPFFRANYSIRESDDELDTLTLLDSVSLEGAYETGVEIVAEEYKDYFSFSLSGSGWIVEVIKNLEEVILADKSQIVTSLSAHNPDRTSFATSAFIITLPDLDTITFDKQYYFGNYDTTDSTNPKVILEEGSEILISNMQDTQISLESMSEYFEVFLNGTTWAIGTKQPLTSTILSQYSELYVEMVIKKAEASYGKAILIIKLPSLYFSKDLYTAEYLVDDDGTNGQISTEDIKIENADEDYAEVKLTNYADFFSVTLTGGTCTVESIKDLTSDITDNYGTLVTSLIATRISDGKTLATTTLVITLPDKDSTDAPNFAHFTFYGEYKNSDPPTVSLEESIQLAYDNQAVLDSVQIDSSSGTYASNFELYQEDYNTYTVNVVEPLSQETIDTASNIVLTLVATSTQKIQSFAALVIELPKAVRNSSVQVENQEILFSGTYDNGDFTSPTINLEFSNGTTVEDVLVTFSNDLGVDNDYFHYTYSDKALTIQIDPLPEDVISENSVLALRLAITDTSTQDTVHAVLNVEIEKAVENHHGAVVGLIVAVSILAVLLALLLLAAFAYWYYRLRRKSYVEMINEETPTKPTTYAKNETKKPLESSLSTNQLRRPTGLALGIPSPIPEHSSTDDPDNENALESPESERRVVFDDNVEKIDNANDEDDEGKEDLQSVADRRPTKFVFGNPLETGVFNLPDDRRESSDYHTYDIPEERRISLGLPEPEGKRAVAFDDNVERMHIDPVEADEEDNDEDSDEEEDEDKTPKRYRTETELQLTDESNLPSNIFKEIF